MAVRPLSPELAAIAAVDLNETPHRLEDGINQLKEWMAKQPHLRGRKDDQWLAAFLRGCKHRVERAKYKLDLYYSLRSISPDLFCIKYEEEKFKALLRTQSVLVLPKVLKPGDPRCVLVRPSLYDPNQFGIIDFFTFMHIFQQIMYLEDDTFMVSGTRGVVDLDGVTMAHIMQLTPTIVKKMVVAVQEASPIRIKSIHFVNFSPVFETILNIVIRLVNDKLKHRLFAHARKADVLFEEFVDKKILPVEYGGSWGSSQDIVDHWLKKFDEYSSWFDEDLKCGTDESRRPGKPQTAGDMFGVEGSFRKLAVD